MTTVRYIPIESEQDVWFLEKHFNVFDFLEFFPSSALASKDSKGKPVTVLTDLGWSFQTDIEPGTFVLRQKSKSKPGTGKWVKESHLSPGDKVGIEKIEEFTYRLFKA